MRPPAGSAPAMTASTSSPPTASGSDRSAPEICANVCFGGPKRNRLFMAASQSLYAVYLDTRGAPLRLNRVHWMR